MKNMQNIDFLAFEQLFEEAIRHFKDHKCGGAPYKNYRDLYDFLKLESRIFSNNLKILEIGTATGFMTIVLGILFPFSEIQSIEIEKDHVLIAEKLLRNFSAIINSNIKNQKIQIIHSEALSYMQYCPALNYEIILFDGFSPNLDFLNQYERILKQDGILISANSHLSQTKTKEYFEKLSDERKWKKLAFFGDTIIYQKMF